MVASLSLLFSFSVAQVLVGLRKQFINNFVFPTWAGPAGFNNNNNNNNNNLQASECFFNMCVGEGYVRPIRMGSPLLFSAAMAVLGACYHSRRHVPPPFLTSIIRLAWWCLIMLLICWTLWSVNELKDE